MKFLSKFKTFFDKVGAVLEKFFGSSGLEQKIEATITYIAPLVNTIVKLVDPALAPEVAAAITLIQADLATASTVVQEGTVAPGSTAEQTVTTALTSVQTNLTTIITDAGVKNSASFTEIDAAGNLILGELQAMLAALTSSTPAATTTAATETATATS